MRQPRVARLISAKRATSSPTVSQALIAAAQVGVARADFLPRLNITGAINVTDNVLGNALGVGLTRATATPLISLPLFDWGQRIAN